MTSPTTDVSTFVAKWRDNARRERASSQEHFIDLCRLLGVPTPNEADPSGREYTFEAGAQKTSGGEGWADVWKRGHFGWEYKGAGRDLAAAYRQLLDYREALENPPLLVVSDMDRIEVHTNFTNTQPSVHTVTLDDLTADGERTAEALGVLRAVMSEPEALRPKQTPDEVTRAAATSFAGIARSMHDRGHHPEAVAHFLNRVLFCLFAEDVGLLPKRILTGMIESRRSDADEFARGLAELFWRMSEREAGRYFGNERVQWFNGGLFDGAEVLPLTREELGAVHEAALLDWSRVEPAILGTLFERGLDPDKRGQLGAHYTDRAKILMVVEPVVLAPLRREFAAMRERVDDLMKSRDPSPLTREGRRRDRLPAWERSAESEWRAFLERLRAVRVLDPACGSGNFLYLALRLLKDLEREAIRWGAERLRISGEFPQVGPHNVLGIEVNPYAKELAGVTIWIGQIQWMRDHGYGFPSNPVLAALDSIELRDAILARDDEGAPVPASWPEAEFIVGNPPFLGNKKLRGSLGERARRGHVCGVGRSGGARGGLSVLLARAGAAADRGGGGEAGRAAGDELHPRRGESHDARSDPGERRHLHGLVGRAVGGGGGGGAGLDRGAGRRVGDGADAGRGAGRGDQQQPHLWGRHHAVRSPSRERGCFVPWGIPRWAAFDIPGAVARKMLSLPSNVNGRTNADVAVPWVNGLDIVRRPRDMFIIDFGTKMTEAAAADYEAPFAYVEERVRPSTREGPRGQKPRDRWWMHQRPRPEMRAVLAPLSRFIGTPSLAKHRLFVWLSAPTLPDHQLIAIARDDDYTFGVLHSRAHELWSLRMGTSLEDRPRYTPSTTFETFPFPWPLDRPASALTAEQRGHREAIGAAARALDAARRRWLNPPEWVREEPDVLPSLPPRVLPVDAAAAKHLAKRTLTNLYNTRPAWLANLHRDLDAAVYASYGWTESPDVESLGEEELLSRLLGLNLERAGKGRLS